MKVFKIVLAQMILAQIALASPTPVSRALSAQSSKLTTTSSAITNQESMKAMGPGSIGGGEPVSQEVRSIISSLPAILRSQGLEYFPEVQIEELDAITKGTVLVEIVDSIVVEGSRKACRFDRERSLIQVDPVEWKKLNELPDAEVRKRAIVFHEVLGLMGIEKNNDYTVSNRLVGTEFLAAVGIKGTKSQILPKSPFDKQVIYWRVSEDGLISFFYCKDRSLVSSCTPLGSRSYSSAELDGKYNQMFSQMQDSEKNGDRNKHMTWGIVLGGVALVAISILLIPSGILFGVGLAVVLLGTPPMSIAAGKAYQQADRLRYQLGMTKRATYQKGGRAETENFKEVVTQLNDFLYSIDGALDINPEGPANLQNKLN